MRAVAVVLLALVLPACGTAERTETARSEPAPAAPPRALAGAPDPRARLHAQSGQLLDGGPAAFRQRLRELKGYPVVVNKWASWCGPCRTEFPIFRQVALERGKQVAFIGVNALDNDEAARRFLEQNPVSFPSYSDPDQEVAKLFRGNGAFPTTAFYDRRGRFVIALQRSYRSKRELAADIERYAR